MATFPMLEPVAHAPAYIHVRAYDSFLPLADGVAFTCRMPKCRYYSLTLYPGVFDPVQDKLPPSLYVYKAGMHRGSDHLHHLHSTH